MILIVKFVSALRKQNITLSLLYFLGYLIDDRQCLSDILLIQPLSLKQIHKFTNQYGIGLRLIHHKRTWLPVGVDNAECIVLSLMIRIHHVAAFCRKQLCAVRFCVDAAGYLHQANHMARQRVALLYTILFRMIRLPAHLRYHIRRSEKIH